MKLPKTVVAQREMRSLRWENDETGSRVNDSRSLTNHLSKQEAG